MLLASHNLSRAAMGEQQKNSKTKAPQLRVRHYEVSSPAGPCPHDETLSSQPCCSSLPQTCLELVPPPSHLQRACRRLALSEPKTATRHCSAR